MCFFCVGWAALKPPSFDETAVKRQTRKLLSVRLYEIFIKFRSCFFLLLLARPSERAMKLARVESCFRGQFDLKVNSLVGKILKGFIYDVDGGIALWILALEKYLHVN